MDRSIEKLNDELLKVEMFLQQHLDEYSNNLKVAFQNLTYTNLLKSNLIMGYEADQLEYPLEFMDTEVLLDEFLKFLRFYLEHSSKPTWLVFYNSDSFISSEDMNLFLNKIKKMLENYDLKLLYLGNTLKSIPIDSSEVEDIVISGNQFHQLLPIEELMRSIEMHYPSNFDLSEEDIVESVKRIASCIGSNEDIFISNKDLVLLKIVNDILGYETSYNLKCQMLSDAETKYLED